MSTYSAVITVQWTIPVILPPKADYYYSNWRIKIIKYTQWIPTNNDTWAPPLHRSCDDNGEPVSSCITCLVQIWGQNHDCQIGTSKQGIHLLTLPASWPHSSGDRQDLQIQGAAPCCWCCTASLLLSVLCSLEICMQHALPKNFASRLSDRYKLILILILFDTCQTWYPLAYCSHGTAASC